MPDRFDYSWLNDYWRHLGHQPERDRFRTLPELRQGTTIARYKVIRTLGCGGVGRVYLAEHELLPKRVAIKVHEDFPSHGGIAIAFRQSASYLCQLNHPNIVFFMDYGIEQNRAYMVMEYVSGPSLSSLLPVFQTRQGANKALSYFAGILDATRYAHNCPLVGDHGEQCRGVIHGDIKPENVLISESDVPKLTDFMVPDVQRLLASRQDFLFGGKPKRLTDVFGTPYYMAPEQVCEGRVSEQTDVFSLGVLLHHMVTGRYPYRSDNYASRERATRPSATNPYIPDWIDAIVEKATELDLDRRYRSVGELQRAFLQHYESASSTQAVLSPPVERARPKWRPGEFGVLPTLVDRNSPELDPILQSAIRALGCGFGEVLARAHATGVREVGAAIYDAIRHTTRLQYDREPATPGDPCQEVRLVGDVLRNGIATCLDLALLYAAALERAHLAPALLLLEVKQGWHALGGYFDVGSELLLPDVLSDAQAIRDLVKARRLIPVETTGLSATHGRKKSYTDACEEAELLVAR